MHQQLADATFRIQCGNSSGSGFSYRSSRIVVTNCHVIEAAVGAHYVPITAITEAGVSIPAKLLRHSPQNQYDFAILELQGDLPAGRHVLQPSDNPVSRGAKTIFAGFPHGFHELLVHEAIVSGPCQQHAFYIDGSVNGGNSGGPIISAVTGDIVGIVTQRRFAGAEGFQAMGEKVKALQLRLDFMRGSGGRITIGGIDFRELMSLMNENLLVISEIIKLNANSGIGIGYHISHLDQAYCQAGLP